MKVLSDLRLTVRRLLRRDRQFAFFACATMALGLWVATLIFGIANGLLLRPLPYKDPGRLARITAAHPETNQSNRGLSEAAVEHLRTLPAIEAVGVYEARGLNVTAGAEPLRLSGAAMHPDVFRLLDVRPVEGRVFSDDEFRRADQVILVSELFVESAGWPREAVRVNLTSCSNPFRISNPPRLPSTV